MECVEQISATVELIVSYVIEYVFRFSTNSNVLKRCRINIAMFNFVSYVRIRSKQNNTRRCLK